MLKYSKLIEDLTNGFLYSEGLGVGQAFEGHPDDPSILEEYYFAETPDRPDLLEVRFDWRLSNRWELSGNVLTIYKEERIPGVKKVWD